MQQVDVLDALAASYTRGPLLSGKNTSGAVCDRCPVREPCMLDALRRERGLSEREGMFGGLTPSARRAVAARHAEAS